MGGKHTPIHYFLYCAVVHLICRFQRAEFAGFNELNEPPGCCVTLWPRMGLRWFGGASGEAAPDVEVVRALAGH